jgi:hypothetical protein
MAILNLKKLILKNIFISNYQPKFTIISLWCAIKHAAFGRDAFVPSIV